MVQRPGKNWGLRAAACAAIIVWQIYGVARASVFSANEGNDLRYLVIGVALIELVAALLKLSADY